jgi:tRNA A37 threonylcarbamoyladenosine biosynthesis protein TsaE
MDAYRLESEAEAEQLDLDAMLEAGPLLIEWPERIASLVPRDRIWIQLETLAEEHRQLRFKSAGRRFDTLLGELRKLLYGVS